MSFVIVRNDITKMPVDAIVNAADEALLGGRGVDGCIHRAAGPELLEACSVLHGCKTVAFPVISAGVFGYPKEEAMRVAAGAIRAFLAKNEMTVYLVVFSRKSLQIAEALFSDIAESIDDRYVNEHAM